MSSADAYRCDGSLANARSTISLSFGGSPGTSVPGDAGFSLSTRYITA